MYVCVCVCVYVYSYISHNLTGESYSAIDF